MTTGNESLIRAWLPPAVRRWGNRMLRTLITYRGPFVDWAAAKAATSGYQHEEILARVRLAIQSVLRGEADYEQDGVAFRGSPPASYALSALLLAACRNNGHLSVLDFGGGLASSYLRWRPLFGALSGLHWAVVEQSHFVAEGNELYAGDPSVSFHEDLAQVSPRPNVVLASSVLQYLADPYEVLHRLASLRADVIVLDRTPCGVEDSVYAQFVPARLGKASYPLWVLSRDKVHSALSRNYTLLSEFDSLDEPLVVHGATARYCGSIWLHRA